MSRYILLLAVLVCSSLFSVVYAIRERREANAMENSRNQLDTALSSARAEIRTLSSRIDAMAATAASAPELPPPAQAHTSPKPSPMERRHAAGQPALRARNTEDPRWKHVESQLASHQSQLANHQSQLTNQGQRITQTQDDLHKTGDQLDGRINSTRDELNRSITANRDDVALLQKRGERNVYNFDLVKSKEFQRVGPLSLSLRKADTKHRSYDLSIMVDDKPVEKQHVNLSEPVWISMADLPQPVELVVNEIDKNRVRGYISAPRYKNGDLAGAPAPGTVQGSTLKQR
jgi:hypothetical protein